MALHTLDVLGLKCPQPILKLAAMAKEIPAGDTVDVLADCESFPKDIVAWSEKTKKTLLFCVDEGGGKHKAQIQF
ncbi:MAG: sulfurtransferase TusA family protein [Dehalococcoidia bacterium]|nr:sulfurtransferase TusA family protein [Dehalococcoidia bacterium]